MKQLGKTLEPGGGGAETLNWLAVRPPAGLQPEPMRSTKTLRSPPPAERTAALTELRAFLGAAAVAAPASSTAWSAARFGADVGGASSPASPGPAGKASASALMASASVAASAGDLAAAAAARSLILRSIAAFALSAAALALSAALSAAADLPDGTTATTTAPPPGAGRVQRPTQPHSVLGQHAGLLTGTLLDSSQAGSSHPHNARHATPRGRSGHSAKAGAGRPAPPCPLTRPAFLLATDVVGTVLLVRPQRTLQKAPG